MKKTPFVADTRNVGGRQAVVESMLLHQARLKKIRNGHNKKKGTGLDMAVPATCSMTHVTARTQRCPFEISEHSKRLQISRQKIKTQTSSLRPRPATAPRNRRVQTNAIATTAAHDYLLSSSASSASSASWGGPNCSGPRSSTRLAGPLLRSQSAGQSYPGRRTMNNYSPTGASAYNRPSFLKPTQDRAYAPAETHEHTRIAKQRENPYQKLRTSLFDLIVEHRIFKEDQLNGLLSKAEQMNTHLDPLQVKEVIRLLRMELEIDDPAAATDSDVWSDRQPSDAAPAVQRPRSPAHARKTTPEAAAKLEEPEDKYDDDDEDDYEDD